MDILAFSNLSFAEDLKNQPAPDFNLKSCNSLQEIYEHLSLSRRFAIIDDTHDAKETLAFISRIKRDPQKKCSRVIIYCMDCDANSIRLYFRFGFDLVLCRNDSHEENVLKISNFIRQNVYQNEKREYVRVKLTETDRVGVVINTRSGRQLSGSVCDISMGGFAGNFCEQDLIDLEHDPIKQMQLTILNKPVMSSARLVNKNCVKASFQFDKLSYLSAGFLTDFIYEKSNTMLSAMAHA